MDFSKWLNHIYLKENPDKAWMKEVSSKSVKQSIMNADKAFRKFFKHQSNVPKFKKKNRTISCKAGRYYISILTEIPDTEKHPLNNLGLGIDLGVKDFAVISNGMVKKNINKTAKIRKSEKQLKREQRCLSRK